MRRITKVRTNARELTADELVEIGDVASIREYFGCTTPTAEHWLLRATRMVKRGSGAEYLERPPVVQPASALPERPTEDASPPRVDLRQVAQIAERQKLQSPRTALWYDAVKHLSPNSAGEAPRDSAN